ncbi:MAG: hypothetical protein U1E65_07955 [Myxococcota bacterium]
MRRRRTIVAPRVARMNAVAASVSMALLGAPACGGEAEIQVITGQIDVSGGGGVQVAEILARTMDRTLAAAPVHADGSFLVPLPAPSTVVLELRSDRGWIPLIGTSSASREIQLCSAGEAIDAGHITVLPGCLAQPTCALAIHTLDVCRVAAQADCNVLGGLVSDCHAARDAACAPIGAHYDRCIHAPNPPPPPACDNDYQAWMGCLNQHSCSDKESAYLGRCAQPCATESSARDQACGLASCPPGALIATAQSSLPTQIGCGEGG